MDFLLQFYILLQLSLQTSEIGRRIIKPGPNHRIDQNQIYSMATEIFQQIMVLSSLETIISQRYKSN